MAALMEDKIRLARPAEAEACADILHAHITARPWMPDLHTRDEIIRFYRDFVFQKREVWVIGEPVAGFMAMSGDTITALYVARPGQGLGRKLLQRAKAGRARLELWTFQANYAAQRFYEREGFRAVAWTEGDNEEGLPDIRMEWRRDG